MQVKSHPLISIFQLLCSEVSETTGLDQDSRHPWPTKWDKCGGIIIPCRYLVYCTQKDFLRVTQCLCQSLAFIPGRLTLED